MCVSGLQINSVNVFTFEQLEKRSVLYLHVSGRETESSQEHTKTGTYYA